MEILSIGQVPRRAGIGVETVWRVAIEDEKTNKVKGKNHEYNQRER